MSSTIIDSLCNNELIDINENILIEKGEVFLTEYRLYIGDIQFYSYIEKWIEYSNIFK